MALKTFLKGKEASGQIFPELPACALPFLPRHPLEASDQPELGNRLSGLAVTRKGEIYFLGGAVGRFSFPRLLKADSMIWVDSNNGNVLAYV